MKNLRNKPLIFTLFRPPFFAKNRGPWRGVFGGPNHQNTNRFRGWQGVQNLNHHFCKKWWFLSMKNENLRNRFEDFLKFYENFIKKNDAFWGGSNGGPNHQNRCAFPGACSSPILHRKMTPKKGPFLLFTEQILGGPEIFENFWKFFEIFENFQNLQISGSRPPDPDFFKMTPKSHSLFRKKCYF